MIDTDNIKKHKVSISVGGLITILGAVLSLYVYFEGPRPALTNELDNVREELEVKLAASDKLGRGAYVLIMMDRYEALKHQANRLQEAIRHSPGNVDLREQLRTTIGAMSVIAQELRELGVNVR